MSYTVITPTTDPGQHSGSAYELKPSSNQIEIKESIKQGGDYPNQDEDWYKFTADNNGYATFRLVDSGHSYPSITLFDENHRMLKYDFSYEKGDFQSELTYGLSAGKTYYVAINYMTTHWSQQVHPQFPADYSLYIDFNGAIKTAPSRVKRDLEEEAPPQEAEKQQQKPPEQAENNQQDSKGNQKEQAPKDTPPNGKDSLEQHQEASHPVDINNDEVNHYSALDALDWFQV